MEKFGVYLTTVAVFSLNFVVGRLFSVEIPPFFLGVLCVSGVFLGSRLLKGEKLLRVYMYAALVSLVMIVLHRTAQFFLEIDGSVQAEFIFGSIFEIIVFSCSAFVFLWLVGRGSVKNLV